MWAVVMERGRGRHEDHQVNRGPAVACAVPDERPRRVLLPAAHEPGRAERLVDVRHLRPARLRRPVDRAHATNQGSRR